MAHAHDNKPHPVERIYFRSLIVLARAIFYTQNIQHDFVYLLRSTACSVQMIIKLERFIIVCTTDYCTCVIGVRMMTNNARPCPKDNSSRPSDPCYVHYVNNHLVQNSILKPFKIQ